LFNFIYVVAVVESVEESVYMATPYDPAETVVLPCSSVTNPPTSEVHLVGQMTTMSDTSAGDLQCCFFFTSEFNCQMITSTLCNSNQAFTCLLSFLL
jgi:hypothetical protein